MKERSVLTVSKEWIFPVRLFVLLTLAVLLGLSSACNLPLDQADNQSDDLVGTSIAETVAARAEVDNTGEQAGTAQPAASDTPGVKATPGPTDTPTQPPTATLTPTPEAVLVSVTGDTFCRAGPGSVYEGQGVLNTDQQSEVLAQDPTEGFWYIANPDAQGECWIWGKYATPQGPADQLPVFTPPPTPTPSLDFSADFALGDIQPAEMYIWFVIKNTGGSRLESVRTVVKSKYKTTNIGSLKNQTSTSTFNAFHGQTQADSPSLGQADPGQTVYTVSGSQLPIHSQNIVVTMTVCSQDNLNGSCVTKNMQFRLY